VVEGERREARLGVLAGGLGQQPLQGLAELAVDPGTPLDVDHAETRGGHPGSETSLRSSRWKIWLAISFRPSIMLPALALSMPDCEDRSRGKSSRCSTASRISQLRSQSLVQASRSRPLSSWRGTISRISI